MEVAGNLLVFILAIGIPFVVLAFMFAGLLRKDGVITSIIVFMIGSITKWPDWIFYLFIAVFLGIMIRGFSQDNGSLDETDHIRDPGPDPR